MPHGQASGAERLFDIQKVADGVYVAVAAHAYKVNSNTAIIENDDGVIVVDSHSKPSAARVIVQKLQEMRLKRVRYVVNTHFHFDHWQGNEVYPATYPNVEDITNDITRETMVRKSLKRIQDHIRAAPAEIAKLRADLETAASADQRAEILSNLRQAESYLSELQALKPALPTMAFERSMRLIRGDREVQLLHLGRAHTEGDVFVYLPSEKVVVTGDAVIGWTPFMGDGYPEDWVGTLKRLEQLDFTQMIMGHGRPAGKDWLRLFRGYIEDLVEAVRREAAAGASLEEIKQRVPDQIAPKYERALSKEGGTYRPWRQLVLTNIERVYATVS